MCCKLYVCVVVQHELPQTTLCVESYIISISINIITIIIMIIIIIITIQR